MLEKFFARFMGEEWCLISGLAKSMCDCKPQSPQREVQTPVMASEAWQTSLQKLRPDLVSCGLRALLLSAPLF